MKFLGKVHSKKKNEKYMSVEIPDLGIYTQGKDFDDCLDMAKDALETVLDIQVDVSALGKNGFTVTSKDLKPLIGRFLETMRSNAGLSIREVSQRVGKSSPNYYAQYESGKSLPGMDLVSTFVQAMKPGYDLVITTLKTE